MKLSDTERTGRLGEVVAARYLRDRDYTILDANFSSKTGELDIVASDGYHLCIVEVKSRHEGQMFPPSEAVDYEKQQKIINTAIYFGKVTKNTLPIRFDIIEVVFTDDRHYTVNHIQNAFFDGESI